MNQSNLLRAVVFTLHRDLRQLLGVAVAVALLATGCGKEATDAPANQDTNAAPAVAPAATTPTATPVVQSAQPVVQHAQLAESQAALQARDYEKAAEVLVSLQAARLSDQQTEALGNQMRQLQKDLAAAVASGDPKAKAAADRLRRSTPR